MVFSGSVIEFSIINAHTPTGDRSSRYKLISFIINNGHTPFLGNYLHRDNPITIRRSFMDLQVWERVCFKELRYTPLWEKPWHALQVSVCLKGSL